MKNLIKLGVALLLAVLAGILNAVYLNQAASYVRVSAAVKQGDEIKAGVLQAIRIPDAGGTLKQSLIPWDDRKLLLQLKANRPFNQGDVLLRRDVEEMFAQTARKTETLRFRVIAVGDRFKRQVNSDISSPSAGNSVTIAVKQPTLPGGEYDLADAAARGARRMVRVVTRQMTGKEPLPEDQILGVAVFPRAEVPADPAAEAEADAEPAEPETVAQLAAKAKKEKAPPKVEQPAPDEMALTIPLEGIQSVPAVILVGGEIGFFMYPEYPY